MYEREFSLRRESAPRPAPPRRRPPRRRRRRRRAPLFSGVLAALVYAPAAYYILWALGIAVFVEMVYFTTKMM